MRPRRLLTRSCLALASLWIGRSAGFGQIYVSPQGDDRNPGTFAAPVASLPRAVALAREKRDAHSDQEIILRGGTYRLKETLVLGLDDSPAPGHTLTFAAYPGERPVISGGELVTGWRKLRPQDTPAALPAAARGHVWVTDLPATKGGAWRFHALYDGLAALPRARSAQYISRHPVVPFIRHYEDRDVLEFPAGSVKAWANLEDVEILARPNHDWLVNYLGLAAVDEAAGTARTTVPATYTLSGRFWVENVLEDMSHPGNWVLNTREGRLYLWPKGAAPGDGIVAPRLETLIRVEGRDDCRGDADRPAGGFRFAGLTFAQTDRDVWRPTDAGLQHDWEMWDKDDACLRFRVARDCEVTGCTFEAAGDNGVRADLYAQGIRIDGNTFRDLGGGGVLFCGYGPGTKDVNRGNEVVDNEFYDLGTLTWHSPAVFLWQSGHNLVAHNSIHDLPYNGIVLGGVRPRFYGISTPAITDPVFPPDLRENLRTMRWREIGHPTTVPEIFRFAHARDNVIRDNEIHDVVQVLHDGNAIYLSATGPGNVVERNVIYRMGDSAAIRTDDDQYNTTITQNVTIGGGIVLKDYNFVWNNILINAGLRIISNRPDSRVDRNVFVSYVSPPRFYEYNIDNRYYFAVTLARHQAIIPPRTDHNLYWSRDAGAFAAYLAEMRGRWGSDQNSRFGDPRFRDPAHGDFRFGPGSPAAALGIASVDTTGAGLLREPIARRLESSGGLDLGGVGAGHPD